jgi:BON domain-containing protein
MTTIPTRTKMRSAGTGMRAAGTTMRAAGTAMRGSAKAARRLPRMRGRRTPRLDIPLPEIHFTSGPKLHVPVPRLEGERPRRRRLRTLGTAGGTAAIVYLLDPQQGRRRRHMARDRGLKLLRQARQRAEKQARYAAGVQAGKRAEQQSSPPKPELNDPALARKVETEIFRDADAPKGSVDVNVERGVVYLRGQVEDQATIERLVEQARAVEGVQAVESLLHLPGEPAPQRTGETRGPVTPMPSPGQPPAA